MVLWAVLIKGGEVYAHAQHLRVLLRDKHGVCYPGGLFNFADELGCEESVDFFTDGLTLWFSKTLEGLFYWSSLRAYFKCVLGEFSGYTWHVSWTPCKYFPVLTEEFDERAFLCDRQVSGHDGRFGGIRRVHLMSSCSAAFVKLLVGCRGLGQWEKVVVG